MEFEIIESYNELQLALNYSSRSYLLIYNSEAEQNACAFENLQ